MSENNKPRLCEVLGVEVNEEFEVKWNSYKYRINENGKREYLRCSGVWCETAAEADLVDLINKPEAIIRIPCLTGNEQAVLRQLKKMGYTKIEIGKDALGEKAYLCKGHGITNVDLLIRDMLPSLKLGQSVDLTTMDLGE